MLFEELLAYVPEWRFFDASHCETEQQFQRFVVTMSVRHDVLPLNVVILKNEKTQKWLCQVATKDAKAAILRITSWDKSSKTAPLYVITEQMNKHHVRRLLLVDQAKRFECEICFKFMDERERRKDVSCAQCAFTFCMKCAFTLMHQAYLDGKEEVLCPHCRQSLEATNAILIPKYTDLLVLDECYEQLLGR